VRALARAHTICLRDFSPRGSSRRSLFLIFVFGVRIVFRLGLGIFSSVRLWIDLLGQFGQFLVRL
jgi:hypothetical protein